MHVFLLTIPQVFRKAYHGRRLMLQIIACVLTYIILRSGFDWYYFTHAQTFFLRTYLYPAALLGFLLPVLIPFFIILGKRKDALYGWMLLQAAFIGWFISSFYKAFTGRMPPDRLNTLHDISHGFQFGFLKHGIFWGWPSSHTAVAFAMAFAAITTTRNRIIQIVCFLLALYVGIGVSMSIHWFSEFVAGALIGSAIGTAVGSTWKPLLKKQ